MKSKKNNKGVTKAVYLTPDVAQTIERMAAREDRSFSAITRRLLEEALKMRPQKRR